MKVVNPVRNVSQIRYDSEGGGGGGTFQEALENAERKKNQTVTNTPPGEVLETMAGLNQYDRHAREIFFAMSSMTDYKC